MSRAIAALTFVVALACAGSPAGAQNASGRIEGRLIGRDARGVPGASVILDATGQTAFTGADGQFSFSGLPPAAYSITFILGHNTVTIAGVQVAAGAEVLSFLNLF